VTTSALFIVPAVLFFVLVEAFFSGSETAITSMNKVLLRDRAEQGDRRARLIVRLFQRTERFLGTTLVGTNLAVVTSTTLAELLISRWTRPGWESVTNTLVMTPLILLAGEMLPKSVARAYADRIAPALARPLRLAQWVLMPLVWMAGRLAGLIADRLGSPDPAHRSGFVTRDDLRTMAEIAAEDGVVDKTAGAMLQALFDLDRRPVSSVMTPLVEVRSLPVTATIQEVERLSVRTGLSRFPIFRDRVDNIVGVVDLRAVLCRNRNPSDSGADRPLRPFVRTDVAFVPENKSAGSLLHELQYQDLPMAIVVDEHGGVVGIVTAEDLIEEIVGEIHDERDRPEKGITQVGETAYECDGRTELRELRERLGIEIEAGDFQTTAGLVLKLAGRIPRVGETFRLNGYEVEVLKIEGRRVARLRFRRVRPRT